MLVLADFLLRGRDVLLWTAAAATGGRRRTSASSARGNTVSLMWCQPRPTFFSSSDMAFQRAASWRAASPRAIRGFDVASSEYASRKKAA